MKDSHLINYNLFCSRTGFDIQHILKSLPNLSYEDFCSMLRKRKVCPPDVDYFIENKKKISPEEIKTTATKKIDDLEKIDKDTEDKLDTPTPAPKKKRRRRTRKKDDV